MGLLANATLVTGIVAGIVACAAAVTDLARGNIYNALTFPAAGAGLLLGLAYGGLRGLGQAAMGLVLCFVLAFIFHVLPVFQGGDVKLFGALGAILGMWRGLSILMLSCVVGGFFSIGVLIRRGRLLSSIAHTFRLVGSSVIPGVKRPEPRPLTEMRFAPSIAIATLLVVTGWADRILEVIS